MVEFTAKEPPTEDQHNRGCWGTFDGPGTSQVKPVLSAQLINNQRSRAAISVSDQTPPLVNASGDEPDIKDVHGQTSLS
jgi:hypothetical protein